MIKRSGFLSILVPSATVFFSSGCIMTLELVASRLIAKHLGSSLYTWTAVIGVVLAGITIGNWVGGRIADRFNAKKTLSLIFALCSASCVMTVTLNNIVGNWLFLWQFNWPTRVFSHVSLVFLLPSVLLGTISPIVAKMALDKGLKKGRTVGDIYAWGAAGSIAGTFAAGYYLIAAIGTVAIIWAVGAFLLVMAILYWIRFWPLYLWAVVFVLLMMLGVAPAAWAQHAGIAVALRAKPDPTIIYEDETPYCYVAIRQSKVDPYKRFFHQDKLKHSSIIINDVLDLQYYYTKIYAAVTHGLSEDKDKLSIMVIGGGGYAYPQYVEKVWPGSRIDVVEIDAGVTKAAMAAFGLSVDTTINSIQMDARNYVDDLLNKQAKGESIPQYDFIYEDAINDYSVPFQLVTKEFNDKIAKLLTNDGVYMVNLIDIYDSGLFLGGVLNTLKQTFPYVYIMAKDMPSMIRNTFVLAAGKKEINIDSFIRSYRQGTLEPWILSAQELAELENKSAGLVITDDYAPIENLLAPVVRASAKDLLAAEYIDRAEYTKRTADYAASIKNYRKAIKANPVTSIRALNEIALIQAETGKLDEAVNSFKQAIAYNENLEKKSNLASIHYNLGVALQRLGDSEQAKEQFLIAIQQFKEKLSKDATLYLSWSRMGDSYASIGNFKAAVEAFAKALSLRPTNEEYFDNLLTAIEYQGKVDEAIELLRKQIKTMKTFNAPKQAISKLQKRLDFLEFKKSKQKSN